jgi:hypothetical protein
MREDDLLTDIDSLSDAVFLYDIDAQYSDTSPVRTR